MMITKKSVLATIGLLACMGMPVAQGATILSVTQESFSNSSFIDVDLTDVGTVDWRHFLTNNSGGTDYKDNVTSRISGLTPVNVTNPNLYLDDSRIRSSWDDGAVTTSVTNNRHMVKLHFEDTNATDAGWQFTVTNANPDYVNVLHVYAGGYGSFSKLTVSLGDEVVEMPIQVGNPNDLLNVYGVVYKIEFAAYAHNTLQVKFGFDPDETQPFTYSNVGIQAAALQFGMSIPEPASLVLLAAGGLLVLSRRHGNNMPQAAADL